MRRTQLFDVKLADGAAGTFEGYASIYGNVDSYGDVVESGAFTKTISERGSKIPVLWQHDSRLPIGTGEVFDAGNGLGIKGRIIDSVSYGADALKLMREGVVKGLSIGYSVMKDAWDADRKVRLLKEVKLYEVSVVTFPANELAVLNGVKSSPAEDEAVFVMAQIASDLKAGKTISRATRAKLQEAINTLTALLAADDNEDNGDELAAKKQPEPLPHSPVDLVAALRELRASL